MHCRLLVITVRCRAKDWALEAGIPSIKQDHPRSAVPTVSSPVVGILNILEKLGCGGLLLSNRGRVLEANGRAQRYLGAHLEIDRRSAARPSAAWPGKGFHEESLEQALRQALRKVAEVDPELGEYLVVPRGTGRPLVLRTVRIKEFVEQPDQPITALIVLDMEDCQQPDEVLLQDLFLLTPAEVRLARELSTGKSLVQVGKEFSVSHETLRAQLKAIFLKTATCRQGELIALLAHLTRLNR